MDDPKRLKVDDHLLAPYRPEADIRLLFVLFALLIGYMHSGLLLGVPSMSSAADIPGIVQLLSRHSVETTIDRLDALLKQRGILVFARIDFSGDAGRAGLRMHPEQMLIFGNPRAGTPLMLAAPTAGLDLPLKMLAWEAPDGQVWAAYNDPRYVVQRYQLPADLVANLAAAVPLIERAVAE